MASFECERRNVISYSYMMGAAGSVQCADMGRQSYLQAFRSLQVFLGAGADTKAVGLQARVSWSPEDADLLLEASPDGGSPANRRRCQAGDF